MNRKLFVLSASLIILFSAADRLKAGTVLVGVKTWYSVWDSAVAKTIGVYTHDYLQSQGFPNSVTVDPGTGYLAGPVAGYQTEDGKWSVSGAYMFLSSFKQESSMDASGVPVSITMDMERRDLDLSAGYSLMENLKVFFGYKWMYTRYDVKYDVSGTVSDEWYEAVYQMPGIGIGTVYPVTEKFLLSGQLGILYVKTKMQHETGYKYSVSDSWGFNFEAAGNYLAVEKILLQLGVRYQTFLLKIDNPDIAFESEQTDKFLGITLSAIYMF